MFLFISELFFCFFSFYFAFIFAYNHCVLHLLCKYTKKNMTYSFELIALLLLGAPTCLCRHKRGHDHVDFGNGCYRQSHDIATTCQLAFNHDNSSQMRGRFAPTVHWFACQFVMLTVLFLYSIKYVYKYKYKTYTASVAGCPRFFHGGPK